MVTFKKISLLALVVLAVVALTAAAASAALIYSNDFQTAVGLGWTASPSGTPTITTAPNGQKFLGTNSNDGILDGTTMTLSLSGLTGYTITSLDVDLYVIRSMDGNNSSYGPDQWQVTVNGGSGPATLLSSTFSNVTTLGDSFNQSYPNSYPVPGGNFAPATNSSSTNTLGYTQSYGYGDSVYKFSFTNLNLPVIGDTLTIQFIQGGNQSLSDESWGLDNIKISGVPLPASSLLLGSGMIGLGLLGWRRKRS